MRQRSLIGLLACLAACAAAAVSTAGCGSSATLDPVAQAAQTTQQAGGSRMALTASFNVPGTLGTLSMNGSGWFNYGNREGTFTMTMSGLPGLSRVSPSGELKLDERIKGSTVYVGSDVFAGKLPGGARWAKLDLQRFLGSVDGVDFQSLSSGESNPAQMLQLLKASSGGARVVGHDRVRGVETTRYRGALDLEKAADQAPSSIRAKAHEAVSKLIAQGAARFIPAEVWIDAQHRVRKFTISMTVSQGGQSVQVAMSVELYDYGPTPPVEAPAAGETYDLTQAVLGGLNKG
jgi:hypothetical protein